MLMQKLCGLWRKPVLAEPKIGGEENAPLYCFVFFTGFINCCFGSLLKAKCIPGNWVEFFFILYDFEQQLLMDQ